MRAINQTSKKELASNVAVAYGILKRMKGLIGRERLQEGEALWIKPCKSVHTIGMKFAIDVIFLDKENNIVAVKKNLGPNRLTPIYLRAASVLELPAGTIDASGTKIGDVIKFID